MRARSLFARQRGQGDFIHGNHRPPVTTRRRRVLGASIPAMARRQPAGQGARPRIAWRKVRAGTRATTTAPQLAWAVCGHSFSSRPPPLLEHVGYMNVTDDVGRADHTAQVTNGQPVSYLWRRHVPTHFSLQVNLRTFGAPDLSSASGDRQTNMNCDEPSSVVHCVRPGRA